MDVISLIKRGEIDLFEAVAHYRRSGQIEELLLLAEDRRFRTDALTILSEMNGLSHEAMGRIVHFVVDDDAHNSILVLDILYASLDSVGSALIAFAVENANILNDLVFAKLCYIFSNAPLNVIHDLGISRAFGEHRGAHTLGITILFSGKCVEPSLIPALIAHPDPLVRLYGCCVTAKFHRDEPRLVLLTPPLVQEDIQFMRKFP